MLDFKHFVLLLSAMLILPCVGRADQSWTDPAFLKQYALPMASSVLKCFDTRFKKDSDGRIVLDPTQSIETYWKGVVNDMPTTAGLIDITTRLCALPENLVAPEQRSFYKHMKAACPVVPVQEKTIDGENVRELAPAQKYIDKTSNCENPELYAVWPFRLYGVGKPDLDVAIAAYDHRKFKLPVGWGYDGGCPFQAPCHGQYGGGMRLSRGKD